jgi:predicted RNA methylase
MKMGFYPLPTEVAERLTLHLEIDDSAKKEKVSILDPCCGKGEALKILSETIGIPPTNVYGIELATDRVEAARTLLPEATIEGPASFFGVRISSYSFSAIYLNPPFDSVLGGGEREEHKFFMHSLDYVYPRGVVILVCARNAIYQCYDFARSIDCHLFDVGLYKFPSSCRQYNEVIVIGRKRPEPIDKYSVAGMPGQMLIKMPGFKTYGFSDREIEEFERNVPVIGTRTLKPTPPEDVNEDPTEVRTWTLKGAVKPAHFSKIEYTDEELTEQLEASPLSYALKVDEETERQRPPLSLWRGHRSLVLASGKIDGVLPPPDEDTFVVRGVCPKVEAVVDQKFETRKDSIRETVVISQIPQLTIRCAYKDGSIVTYAQYGQASLVRYHKERWKAPYTISLTELLKLRRKMRSEAEQEEEARKQSDREDRARQAKEGGGQSATTEKNRKRKIDLYFHNLSPDSGRTEAERVMIKSMLIKLIAMSGLKEEDLTVPDDVDFNWQDVEAERAKMQKGEKRA